MHPNEMQKIFLKKASFTFEPMEQSPPGEKVSCSIKMRGWAEGAVGVQVSEGIIYEAG